MKEIFTAKLAKNSTEKKFRAVLNSVVEIQTRSKQGKIALFVENQLKEINVKVEVSVL